MTDITLEILGAIFSGIILFVLASHISNKNARTQSGSKLILTGFSLFFFGMLIDITDNFPELNYLLVIGDTEYQAFLEKVIGTLLGLLFISIGFYKWLPSITELDSTKAKLEKLNNELDDRVAVRTQELEVSARQLKDEIERRQQVEKKLREQALFDGLTKLPNRTLILDRLSHYLNEAQRDDEKVVVLFLDLDDFKKVNDSLGHETGDKLLIQAASRLTAEVRSCDTVGRLGGDEFIIVLRRISNITDAGYFAKKILKQFREPFIIDNHQFILTASIGISVYPDDDHQVASLLRHADLAMYHSKETGRNTYSFFTKEMNDNVSRRLQLEEQMYAALDRDEFYVVYQPKIDLKTNIIKGAEALLRWNNPVFGDVSPVEFIPLAEQTGLIKPLGQFVLSKALEASAKWIDKIPEFRISINLSPIQFRDQTFIKKVKKTIDHLGISSHCLEFEITEGVLLNGHQYIDDVFNSLSSLGISIAMDDFGTGYSSLSYLRKYPFNVIKIDRSFINDVATNQSDRELISATIAMAHGLNLKVVAEGVETNEQLIYLRNLGCDYVQGFLFSKPVTDDKFDELIESNIYEQTELIVSSHPQCKSHY